MTRLTVMEFLIDLRSMFRGWRLVFHLVLFGLVIIMSRSDGESEVGYMVMMYCIFSTAFMRPRINRLFYLLPTSTKDRVNYILYKCIGIFVLNILLYLGAIMITILFSEYQFYQELPTMFCNVIPLNIAYCSLCMGNGYYIGKSKDEEMTKKYQNRYVVSFLLATPTMFATFFFNISFFKERLQGTAMIIITILSYIFAIACMYIQSSVLKHTELSEENLRKVEKLFD